jgi:hypothetical protein
MQRITKKDWAIHVAALLRTLDDCGDKSSKFTIVHEQSETILQLLEMFVEAEVSEEEERALFKLLSIVFENRLPSDDEVAVAFDHLKKSSKFHTETTLPNPIFSKALKTLRV